MAPARFCLVHEGALSRVLTRPRTAFNNEVFRRSCAGMSTWNVTWRKGLQNWAWVLFNQEWPKKDARSDVWRECSGVVGQVGRFVGPVAFY